MTHIGILPRPAVNLSLINTLALTLHTLTASRGVEQHERHDVVQDDQPNSLHSSPLAIIYHLNGPTLIAPVAYQKSLIADD